MAKATFNPRKRLLDPFVPYLRERVTAYPGLTGSFQTVAASCLLLAALPGFGAPGQPDPSAPLKGLSLEELSQVEVTSPSKEPKAAFRVPMAIYVITGADMRSATAVSLPGVNVASPPTGTRAPPR